MKSHCKQNVNFEYSLHWCFMFQYMALCLW